jgi:KUP system potassium uptake protein
MSDQHHSNLSKFTVGGALVTLGIVFGDIGTSPLYVMKAIVGNNPISRELIFGAFSCVFWTLAIITTLKYVILALQADNKGEGGIFALYASVKRYPHKWVIYPALLGCATLIADGFITPPLSVSSAIEGLVILMPEMADWTMYIVIAILILLFMFQQVGTQIVGKLFGPVMMLWFGMLAVLGFWQIKHYPEVLMAFNPYYAISLLSQYPGGFALLGGVFLCTTGAEAMYSDLGHCGKWNIRYVWGAVMVCLLINYLGQSAYLLHNFEGQPFTKSSVFYSLMPDWFLPYGIVIAALATIIASQALISGIFTLVNEAMKLGLWINHKVHYPTQLRGQIYIPAINWFLLAGCLSVVFIFKKATNMEHAYGMAIVLDMLMTSVLLIHYLRMRRWPEMVSWGLGILFVSIELCFLYSNIGKIPKGGWFTLSLTLGIFSLLLAFYKARQLRQRHEEYVLLDDIIPKLKDLQEDETIQKEASNLVFLTNSNNRRYIDSNIVYSIFRKKPKRADVYWFVHIDILDEPYAKKYTVDTIIPGKVFFIRLQFGFKVESKVNRMLRVVIEDLVKSGEVDGLSRHPSLRKWGFHGDFKFFLINSRISIDNEVSALNQWFIRVYRILKRMSLSTVESFGLEVTNVETETVPINIAPNKNYTMTREE